jgi:hypothetical protein
VQCTAYTRRAVVPCRAAAPRVVAFRAQIARPAIPGVSFHAAARIGASRPRPMTGAPDRLAKIASVTDDEGKRPTGDVMIGAVSFDRRSHRCCRSPGNEPTSATFHTFRSRRGRPPSMAADQSRVRGGIILEGRLTATAARVLPRLSVSALWVFIRGRASDR